MAFNKKFFTTGGIVASSAACLTETTDIFGGSTGKALYSMDYDASDTLGVYDGTPTNVDFGVGGKINTGARFNGSSSLIAIGSPIPNTDTNVAISAWVKLNSGISGNMHITGTGITTAASEAPFRATLQYQSANTFRLFALRQVAGTYYLADNSTLTDVTMNADVWYHVVWSYNATGRQLSTFLNGTPIDANKTMGTSGGSVNDSTTVIGSFRSTSGPFFDGTIDQLRIFSSTIDSTQASTLAAEQACVHTSTTDIVDFPLGTTNAAYYKLDNSAEDSKGTNDGTETDIEYRFGRYGQAAVFNGSSSFIETSSEATTTEGNKTISGWIFSSVANNGFAFVANGKIILEYTGNAFKVYKWVNGKTYYSGAVSAGEVKTITTSASYSLNTWYHVAIMQTGTGDYDFKLYINGTEPSTTQGSTAFGGYTASNFIIGSGAVYDGTRYNFWNGSIDQVRVFTSALSTENITSLYNEKPETDTSNFKTVLWNATGASNYISNVGIDLETSGGLVWTKAKNQAYNHSLYDSVRGVNKLLQSNTTNTENPVSDAFNSFEANGFFLGANDNSNDTSGGATNSVGWVWKGGGTPILNEIGDIDSSVSANTAAGFSISKGTAPSSSGTFTVGHGLTSAPPELVIYKTTDEVGSWITYTATTGASAYLTLNGDAAAVTGSAFFGNTAPTSSVYTLNSGVGLNTGKSFLGLCFHSVAGYQKIGSYTGNSSTTGPIVYTTDDGTSSGNNGFRPRFIMVKGVTASYSSHWMMMDSVRDTDTEKDKRLLANLANIETDDANWKVEFLDNGFQPKSTFSGFNDSNGTYIFLAIK